jgi:sarcosine oxidase subunit alpha
VERAKIAQVDTSSDLITGTDAWLSVDTICLSVGLQPLCDLLWLAGADFIYLEDLGGFVPVTADSLESTATNVFVAGDASGIEEASVAMEQGRLAGLSAARAAGYRARDFDGIKAEALRQITELRSGPGTSQVRAACDEIERAARGRATSHVVRQSLAGPECAISWD